MIADDYGDSISVKVNDCNNDKGSDNRYSNGNYDDSHSRKIVIITIIEKHLQIQTFDI